MDSGSQRTYVTSRIRDQLNLPSVGAESLRIKTFGATETQNTRCDIVELGVNIEENKTLKLNALVVPFICNSLTSQPTGVGSGEGAGGCSPPEHLTQEAAPPYKFASMGLGNKV